MWLTQWHLLTVCLGVSFLMVTFLETVESKSMMGKNQWKNGKAKLGFGSKGGKTRNSKRGFGSMGRKKNKKSSKKQKVPSKPTLGKPQSGSNTKISVYNCPSEAVEMNCLSCRTRVYRRCPVAGANKITKVQVLREYTDSYGKCKIGRKENFGIVDDSKIWVDAGCRARFLICYEKGKHEPKTINCMYTTSKHRCPTGLHGLRLNIDIKINILWSFGSGKCREGDTWGYDKDDIWVDRGCSATFRVVW